MDPLSMRIASLPTQAEAANASTDACRAASPFFAGQAVSGCGGLANRQIAVGAGDERTRANMASTDIGAILCKTSSELQAVVLGPRA